MEVRRVKATVAYDGTDFSGFQIQKNARSVQEELQVALFKITKEITKVTGSGRTDRGVHAEGQVIHFDTTLDMNEIQWKKALNSNLPSDIYIKEIEFVDKNFHARISAKKKTYMYWLNMGEYDPSSRNHCYQYGHKLDVEKMNTALSYFIGTHDFRNFCSNPLDSTKSFERTIYEFEIRKTGDLLCFKVTGSGFMRYMVRMMVGTLIEIGSGRKNVSEITDRLDNMTRNVTAYNAPSEGLILVYVYY